MDYESRYLELTQVVNEAVQAWRDVYDRFRVAPRPLSGDDPIWYEWHSADERVKAAKDAVRAYLRSVDRLWRPGAAGPSATS